MLPKNNLISLQEARGQMFSFIKAYKPSKTIRRLEIKVRPVDMMAWLTLQKDEVKIYGANQSDSMSIAGIGEAVCIRAGRLGSFKKVFQSLRSFLLPQYPYLQWYGGFCFDDRHQDGDWKEFGAYRFILPRFELAAQAGKMIFCCNLIGKIDTREVLKQLAAIRADGFGASGGGRNVFSISRRTDQPDQRRWENGVSRILRARPVKKVVLARKTVLDFQQVPDPWAMLRQLKAVTPNSYHFAFQFKNKVFLGASPERLYQRFQRSIESEALAGTMPKSAAPSLLQKSEKNKYEHALVVDAIDGSFKQLCTAFRKDRRPGILTLPNGHHLITKFQGQLKDGVNDEDILQFLHPTPALGGTPRPAALKLIRILEGFSRGWYGAPIGYVGLDWAEFVVGIRSGHLQGKKLSVFAGAGIVQGSEARAEWNEVENKISNFIKIIR
ncbi:MAG: isochorismate synthase [Candidatus Omnitrophica bacterium]|nr:isochorismate synthase [Candidatus Omnitrophota bacterium]MDE2009082.1 isochorismate synthase [Candidatus Omnitrophota bacterium]MDE2231290.1 isochorismate synthase [Candidatus Omnitrophota bacterium]